jgi:hypothetical protein
MVFSSDGRFLIYDALNVIKLTGGSTVSAWSIYAIDLVTRNTLLIVPPIQGYDIGFPSLGHTSDNFMAFEAVNQQTGQSTILAGNLVTGKVAAVGTVNNDYGVPAYTGDDSAIVYSVPDFFQFTEHSVYKQALAGDHITPKGDPILWLEDADDAVVYRRGAYRKMTVTKVGAGHGKVTSNVGGINCEGSCSAIYPKGTTVKLTARPYVGSKFAGWKGVCSGTGTCTVTLNQDRSVTATFRLK